MLNSNSKLFSTFFIAGLMFAGAPAPLAIGQEKKSVLSMKGLDKDFATPAGRLLIGRGKDYVPVGGDKDPEALFAELKKNMKVRREFAWKIVEQMLQPTTIKLPDNGAEVDVPLWQTWYDGTTGSNVGTPLDELTGLFNSFFDNLKANPTGDLEEIADRTLDEQGKKNLAQSVTVRNFTAVLRQNADRENVSLEFGGQGQTMFSPSFVKHMMVTAKNVENCSFRGIKPDTDPPSDDNFSHCFKEFPRDAVMVKTAWRKLEDRVAIYNTSAGAMTHVINDGTWPGGFFQPSRPPTIRPSSDQIYTNATNDGAEWGLTGIHFVTKDVREWVWVSLWWSPDARADFGEDQPEGIAKYNNGVWRNYKMCVGSSFDEGDPKPWSHYSDDSTLGGSIRAVYDAIQNHTENGVQGQFIIGFDRPGIPPAGGRGPWNAPHNKNTTWCSNPFIEVHPGNARTSCIGCHQLVLTESVNDPTVASSFAEAMFGGRAQFARARIFKNFSADFSWAFEGQFQGLIKNSRQSAGFEWP